MTRTEAYDAACTKFKEPALVLMGDRHIVGEWVSNEGRMFGEWPYILVGKTKAVRIIAEGSSWVEAVTAAIAVATIAQIARPVAEVMADIRTTSTRLATVADIDAGLACKEVTAVSMKSVLCPTYGCGEPRKPGDPFCAKCFEEHRDAREMSAPSPPSRKS